MLLRIVPWLLLPLLIFAACEVPDELEEPTPEERQPRQMVDLYRQAAQQRLSSIDQSIEEIRRDTVHVAEGRLDVIRRDLEDLEEDRDELATDIEELGEEWVEQPDDDVSPGTQPEHEPFEEHPEDATDVQHDEREGLTEAHREIERRLDDLEQRADELRLRVAESEGDFQELAHQRLDEIELDIEDLQHQIEGVAEEIPDRSQDDLIALQERQEQIRQTLDDRIAEEDFEVVREEVAAQIADLRRSVREIEATYQEEIGVDGIIDQQAPPAQPVEE